MESKRIFNLLKPIEPPPTVWDKIYDWIVKRAKIVVLVTQIVIALAFFGKVTVDTIAKRKEETINKATEDIIFFSNLEPEFRDIYEKDIDYRKIWDKSSQLGPVVDEIYRALPNAEVDITLQITASDVSITGKDTLTNLKQLEETLKGSQSFTNPIFEISQEQRDVVEGKARFTFSAKINKSVIFRPKLLGV